MLDHRIADRATAPLGTSRELVDADLRPLLDHLARLLAEEFRAKSALAPEPAATHAE